MNDPECKLFGWTGNKPRPAREVPARRKQNQPLDDAPESHPPYAHQRNAADLQPGLVVRYRVSFSNSGNGI